MKKLYFIVLICLVPHFAFSELKSKVLSDKELKMIEDRVQTELKGKNLDDKKKFFLNLRAGRDLYQFHYYDKAETYYRNAINSSVDENKSEAYINIIAIGINQENKDKVKKSFDEAREYFSHNPKYKTNDVDYYMKAIEAYLPGKNKAPTELKGFYGRFAREENLENLLKDKEYAKAFSLINPEGLKNSTSDFHIIVYDSLNVYLNKKNVHELYCDKQYKEYPKSFAASIVTCALLNDYLKDGKFNEAHLKRAQSYFAANKEKNYLFEMVKEISK